MKRTILLILSYVLIIAGLLGAISCGTSYQTSTPTTTPTQGNTVSIQNLAFSPATLTVPAGTTVTWTNNDTTVHTVTWTNNDTTVHTVTSNTGLFESGQISKGSTFSHTFNDKGTFEYHCSIHTTMKGTIKVQ